MEFIDTHLIDAISKLSVEVVAILALAFIIRWIAQSNNQLTESHKTMAESNKVISESHEKLVKVLDHNTKRLDDLVGTLSSNTCHKFKGKFKK